MDPCNGGLFPRQIEILKNPTWPPNTDAKLVRDVKMANFLYKMHCTNLKLQKYTLKMSSITEV